MLRRIFGSGNVPEKSTPPANPEAQLKSWMEQLAKELNTKFEDRGNGLFKIDVPLKYPDGTWRYQMVWGRIQKAYTKDKRDVFYFQSRSGEIGRGVDIFALLREGTLGIYSMLSVITESRTDGTPCEMVYVQASPVVDWTTSYDIVKFIITEVASVGDFLEKKYFGGTDTH
ncbi:MAG: hypothetical protein A3K10_06390 [Bacteroidetes bacterium RIFCSPLOWO2_12_FULL_31_6]|nr:MAG: hypothetical protein A3K10_06390 [Bacteroidetes bacterium RIFCSPLOWO2_12_FULL_31_6]